VYFDAPCALHTYQVHSSIDLFPNNGKCEWVGASSAPWLFCLVDSVNGQQDKIDPKLSSL
jgi:hypothetical protein